ncbi:MAG: IS21 family transposase, partial [Ornithinimicrobium sp.]
MSAQSSKVELYAAIRRDVRAGLSQRAIQAKHSVSRSTVVAAEASAWPTPRKKGATRFSKLDPFKPVIDAWLRADLDAPRKQRHTVKRIFDRLLDEQAMTDVTYSTVRLYVSHRRPEVRVEAGRGPADVFIPQSHLPGMEAEVDFGDVTVALDGEMVV